MPSASAPSKLAERAKPAGTIPRCGAKTRKGHPCSQPAGFGTDHEGYGNCRFHGGCTPNGAVHAAKLEAAALALEYQCEPHEALLRAVGQAARFELRCRSEVARLEAEAEAENAAAGGKLLVKEMRVRQDAQGGTTIERSNRAQLHAWVKAHQQAIRDLASIAKTALDAGVEERRVRLAEQLGGELGDLFAAVFEQLQLSADQQQRAPGIVRAQLELLEGGVAA